MKTSLLLFACVSCALCGFGQTPSAKRDSSAAGQEKRVGDYVKFNVQLGVVVNQSFSNVERPDRRAIPYKFSSERYSAKGDDINAGFNVGFNLLLGKSKIIQHVLGANYLLSRGEYSYSRSHTQPAGYYIGSSYVKDVDYSSTIGFLNLVSGIRLRIVKGLSIEPLASINIQLYAVGRVTGYERSAKTTPVYFNPATGRDSLVTTTSQVNYDNTLTHDFPTGKITTISFTPRISYEFSLKEHRVGAYVSYNMALKYRLPWWMFGVSWYPFRKLR
jgi:hypothetical protein